MAALFHRCLALALLSAPVGRLAAETQPAPQPAPIAVVAQSSEIDYGNNELVFRKVRDLPRYDVGNRRSGARQRLEFRQQSLGVQRQCENRRERRRTDVR